MIMEKSLKIIIILEHLHGVPVGSNCQFDTT